MHQKELPELTVNKSTLKIKGLQKSFKEGRTFQKT